MHQSNDYLRAAILTRDTVARLLREGHSIEQATRFVTAVINAEEFALMKGRHTFDIARFRERLRELPE
ncbi:MAG TPA: hypothetical protein VLT36_16815 [Candidatus Dormibacteraeota bacterium]|nr:hypothetical protein [Candidatus Dormibacteraeota bacterium]